MEMGYDCEIDIKEKTMSLDYLQELQRQYSGILQTLEKNDLKDLFSVDVRRMKIDIPYENITELVNGIPQAQAKPKISLVEDEVVIDVKERVAESISKYGAIASIGTNSSQMEAEVTMPLTMEVAEFNA